MSPFLSRSLLFNSIIILVRAFNQLPISHSLQQPPILLPNKCTDRCGRFQVPFPFHFNNSCRSDSDAAFHLSCLNSTALYLNIASQSYRIFDFFSDGVLVDFPGATAPCRQYFDVNLFGFDGNEFYAISVENVLDLYDCEDSSVCKAECEKISLPSCGGNAVGTSSCCYPLSDPSVWQVGDGFSVFADFGCRGFSSWVVPPHSNSGKRGVKLEWAIPRDSPKGACASNAFTINATMVRGGIRCVCQNGFIGDGFEEGVGCLKSCIVDGREAYGEACHTKRHSKMIVVILAGSLALTFTIVSLVALYALLRWSIKPDTCDPNLAQLQSTISSLKACRTRLFTYRELEEGTKGFEDGQKLVDGVNGTVHVGVLADGLHVAVQKVPCKSHEDLMRVLNQAEILSTVSHRNVARVLGCCISSGSAPLVVYEYPANGTLEERLHQGGGRLEWYRRLNIAVETASALAYLQYEISPPIHHHDLKSGSIFLDQDYSIKIAGFGLNSNLEDGSWLFPSSEGSHFCRSDVSDIGVVLLEIITGSRCMDVPTMALSKIKSGKLEEMVDPLLYYHEQPPFCREQIEIVADLATRCLLFGGDGTLVMMDVARELVQITKESLDSGNRRGGPTLEETFSNSSLLQMISMSPDSIYVP